MALVYLFLAGPFEVGWPVGLKMAQQADTRAIGVSIAVACMAISSLLFGLAQRAISIGTSYAA